MPRLEGTRADSGLDDASVTRLVAFVLSGPWNDYWVSRAVNWIEEGAWDDEFSDDLHRISQDQSFSQNTRHRAWQLIKTRP